LCCTGWLFFSCSMHPVIDAFRANTPESYCVPTITYSFDPATLPTENGDSLAMQDLSLRQVLSPHDILTANAIGVLPLIPDLLRVARDSSLQGRLRYLELKTRVHDRFLSAGTEINSIASELDCEGERADQLGAYLDNLNKKKSNALTAASIIAGAATTVGTVLAKGDNAKNTIAISGGLLSAGLTGFTISPRGKRIRLLHYRNLLEDIWYAPTSSAIYPPGIWYILREKAFSNGGQVSLLESIRRRWTHFELNGPIDSARQNLLFKNGGIYTADDLHTRASMLNQLQATIRSINEDLQGLILSLDRIR